jgi:hypothetical protein
MYGQVIEKELGSRNMLEKEWAASRDALEEKWEAERFEIENAAMAHYLNDGEKGRDFLANYTNEVAGTAWAWAKNLYRQFARVKIQINASQISISSTGTFSVTILSSPTFNAATIIPTSISMGVGYTNAANWAKPISVVPQVAANGMTNLVATFNIPDLVNRSKGDATVVNLQELFLQGEWMTSRENAISALGDGKLFVAEGVVPIVP